jgi:hypothetical protein
MIDPNSKFTVLFSDNAVFSNLSDSCADLTRDNINIQMVAAEDKLYIGLHKPFNSLFVELVTPNVTANSFTVELWNGTMWASVATSDETKGWTRSGFMLWDSEGMESTAVNTITKYYIRLTPSVNHSATVLRGINLVFSDDNAMKSEFFEISNSNILPAGEVSHIGTHVASRNYIIHQLRNHYTKTDSAGVVEKINQFDLFDVFEVREAATFLSLAKIFFNLSDNQEDHWWLKYREYQDKYEQKMIMARMTIDQNDDGIADSSEKQRQFNPVRWAR